MLAKDGATGSLKIIVMSNFQTSFGHDTQVCGRSVQQDNNSRILYYGGQRRKIVEPQRIYNKALTIERQLKKRKTMRGGRGILTHTDTHLGKTSVDFNKF